MKYFYIGLYCLVGMIVITVLFLILRSIFKSPFKYPHYYVRFDISGKRAPNIDDLIDRYLIEHGINEFIQHYEKVTQWKNECNEKITHSKLKKLRQKQYDKIVDDEHMFYFNLVRKQTRYRQVNYEKSSYKVSVIVDQYCCPISTLRTRYNDLAEIDFECTLSEYNSKDQRKRMTKALRDEIAKRDNYTCQICEKYMPDCVGLHIDHIIPIKKGGKSVPSNLQVLCSKCNGRKSSN